MRVVIAMMKHETNTFSPVPTPIERFARGFPLPPRGAMPTRLSRAPAPPWPPLSTWREREGWEIVTPIAAQAAPSAPVQDAAYSEISDAICEAVAAGCDAVMLDLHGAMVTESLEDGEGDLLAAATGDRARRADRRRARHAHQPLSRDGRQRDDPRRLHRPIRTSTTTRRACAPAKRWSRSSKARRTR